MGVVSRALVRGVWGVPHSLPGTAAPTPGRRRWFCVHALSRHRMLPTCPKVRVRWLGLGADVGSQQAARTPGSATQTPACGPCAPDARPPPDGTAVETER